jgi:thiamine biosynthesis lipoprotein
LNRQPVGRPFQVPDGLCTSLSNIFVWHAATAGTFDPAIGRLTDAWGIHAGGRVPPADILRDARAASGLALVEFSHPQCEVTRLADVALDVGGFGKGDALDRAARALGDARWMIDLGGQVSVNGAPPGERGWHVAIAHPRNRERPVLDVRLASGSLATSGGSERDVEVDGRRVGHILDPRTGEPASFDGSVTVWHERGLAADVLSTALYVMGPDDGLTWAESRNLSAVYLVPTADGDILVRSTTAWRVPDGPLLTGRE